MGRKVVIGIHGLANKPDRKTLEQWWREALAEGLAKNCRYRGELPFRMVYWADLLYAHPMHRRAGFELDRLYNTEPYVPADRGALQTYDDGWLDLARSKLQAAGGNLVEGLKKHLGVDALADWLIERFARDLDFYYDEKRRIAARPKPRGPGGEDVARRVLQDELRRELRRHAGKEVMVIAHSMGSIIAYDVLRDLGQSKDATDQRVRVSQFVTIGSPLGLPHVMAKIVSERGYDRQARDADRVRTPTIVTGGWKNFADKRDPVAFDTHLGDDYGVNAAGVQVVDDLVQNDYRSPPLPGSGKREGNAHKSYGYLRTPELSRHVREFLG